LRCSKSSLSFLASCGVHRWWLGGVGPLLRKSQLTAECATASDVRHGGTNGEVGGGGYPKKKEKRIHASPLDTTSSVLRVLVYKWAKEKVGSLVRGACSVQGMRGGGSCNPQHNEPPNEENCNGIFLLPVTSPKKESIIRRYGAEITLMYQNGVVRVGTWMHICPLYNERAPPFSFAPLNIYTSSDP
jgi:hypothetical protein